MVGADTLEWSQGGFAISLDSNWIVWACFYPEKPAIWAQKKHRNYPVLKS